MLNNYFKNKTVKNITIIFLLAMVIYAFVEWREQRLERRAKMLPQETQLDLSQVGSEGRVEFLIDSHTGKQGVYIEVYTLVEVLKKDMIKTTKDATKKMYVDIYDKYEVIDNNPNKYQDWKDIELEITIKSKKDKAVFMLKNCFPYDFKDYTKDLPLRSRCGIDKMDNGSYTVNIKVLRSNLDFKNSKSKIIFTYFYTGDKVDFFNSIFDSILEILSVEEWK